jgi:hypothetical protein
MCNLYSMTKTRHELIGLFDARRDAIHGSFDISAIYSDRLAPIVRLDEDGTRELMWGPGRASIPAERTAGSGRSDGIALVAAKIDQDYDVTGAEGHSCSPTPSSGTSAHGRHTRLIKTDALAPPAVVEAPGLGRGRVTTDTSAEMQLFCARFRPFRSMWQEA